MQFKLLVNFALIACLSVFAVACGGGGGGSSDPEPASSTGSNTEPTQNTLLPLVSDTSLNYNESNTRFSPTLYDVTGEWWIYKVSYSGISHYFSSTTSGILLHRIDGPFVIDEDEGTEIDNIRFDPPIPVWTDGLETPGANQMLTGTYGGVAQLSIDGIGTDDIAFDILNTDNDRNIRKSSKWNKDEATPTWVINPVPTKEIVIDLTLEASIDLGGGFTREETIDLDARFYLAEGLGIVYQYITYINKTISPTLYDLSNLPHPIRFESDNLSNPVDNNSTFRMCEYTSEGATRVCANSINLSSEEYSIANQTELEHDELKWITIQEDDASQTFNVTLSSDRLPMESTSVAVIFQHIESGKFIPANVTLTVSD